MEFALPFEVEGFEEDELDDVIEDLVDLDLPDSFFEFDSFQEFDFNIDEVNPSLSNTSTENTEVQKVVPTKPIQNNVGRWLKATSIS